MKRCADCRFWEQHDEHGVCLKIDENKSKHGVVIAVFPLEPRPDDDIATELRTPPDFGCVIWEAK